MRPNYCGRDDNNANKSRPEYGAMPHYLSNNNSLPPSISLRANHGSRSYITSRQSRSPSYHDQEQENGSGPARRRIPVACLRCRKRKIRCSGDPGNGSGCQNCRTAGADINACQFHRVNSIEFPMPLQYEMSQTGLPVRDISHQYNNSLLRQNALKERCHDVSIDDRSSLLSSNVSPQHLMYQVNINNCRAEGRSDNQCGSATLQNTGRDSSTIINTRNLDNSRGWHSQLMQDQNSDVITPDQNTADMYSRNLYQYTQNQEQTPGQPINRTGSVTSVGITALDTSIPPLLVDRQLPMPTGGRIVGSTMTTSEPTPGLSSMSSNYGFNGIHADHNAVYGKRSSTWSNKYGIGHPFCSSSGNVLSHDQRDSSIVNEGEGCDDTGLSPMSCVSPQCTPESFRSSASSAYPMATDINTSASLTGREFSQKADAMPSKHGIPPSLYTFSSDYPRQQSNFDNSFEGSLNNGQKCSPLY